MKIWLFLVICFGASSHSVRWQGFLASDADTRLQPDVAAYTLVQVEEEWRLGAAAYAECQVTHGNSDPQCDQAVEAFQKSCSTVVKAILQASDGDRRRVQDYMGAVCSESVLQGWHQQRCSDLAEAVRGAMKFDKADNREYVSPALVCSAYWSHFTLEEAQRVVHEQAEREAQEKHAAETRLEAEREAAKEAAELQKNKEKEEEERKAAQEKHRAEEAAAKLAAEREQAERQAAEAKQKMQEAQAAAEEAARRHQEAVHKAETLQDHINKSHSGNFTEVNGTLLWVNRSVSPLSNASAMQPRQIE
jgi:hypothetical protein